MEYFLPIVDLTLILRLYSVYVLQNANQIYPFLIQHIQWFLVFLLILNATSNKINKSLIIIRWNTLSLFINYHLSLLPSNFQL